MEEAQLIQRVNQFIRDNDLTDDILKRQPDQPLPGTVDMLIWLEFEATQEERAVTYQRALEFNTSALTVCRSLMRWTSNIQELGLEEMILELEEITNTN